MEAVVRLAAHRVDLEAADSSLVVVVEEVGSCSGVGDVVVHSPVAVAQTASLVDAVQDTVERMGAVACGLAMDVERVASTRLAASPEAANGEAAVALAVPGCAQTMVRQAEKGHRKRACR